MKRIAAILLSTVMVLSLFAGCAGGQEETPTPDTPDVSTTTSALAQDTQPTAPGEGESTDSSETPSTAPADGESTTPSETESADATVTESADATVTESTATTATESTIPSDSTVTTSAENTTAATTGTQSHQDKPETTAQPITTTAVTATKPDGTSAVTAKPTATPVTTQTPTAAPTAKPTAAPTAKPTATPTATAKPTAKPTAAPTATAKPTAKPTAAPTATAKPTAKPTTAKTTAQSTTRTTVTTTQKLAAAKLNGTSLSLYTLVYPADASMYVIRAAAYIYDEILARTGAEVTMLPDDEYPDAGAHEILVGETNRSLSKELNTDTKGLEFAMLAKGGHVAMEADYFVIAAAAYYFIETYVPNRTASTAVPDKVTVNTPISEKAENIIFLIGDGMGINQTKLVSEKGAADDIGYTDGENFFYGELLPYAGYAKTNSLDGVTDSAASATALATGYKTKNGRIGRDKDKNDLKSITEMALEMGKRACVMTTEGLKGATPAGFSAHADNRDEGSVISECQNQLCEKYPIIFTGNFDIYTDYGVMRLEETIQSNLSYVSKGDKGFFMMYEEAYIDKHSHNQDKEKAAWAVFRFNQAIATFMEFAFYNPNTAVIITADHETGGLANMAGIYKYAHGNHSGSLVPVYAYGQGMDVFHDQTIENVQIPKTLAKMWGKTLATDTDSTYPPLTK